MCLRACVGTCVRAGVTSSKNSKSVSQELLGRRIVIWYGGKAKVSLFPV